MDEEKLPPPVGRGAGRGALIRKLLAEQIHAKPPSTNPSSSSGSVVDDSGVSISTTGGGRGGGPISLSSGGSGEERAKMGRGIIAKLLLNSSSSSSNDATTNSSSGVGPTVKGGIGRAKYIELCKSHLLANKSLTTITSATFDESKTATELQEDTSVDAATAKLEDLTIKSQEGSEESEEPEAVIKKGTAGTPINILSNYIRLQSDPDKGVFEYEVKFQPQVHDVHLRHKLLNQQRDTIGNTKTFDGCVLYLPIRLPDKKSIFKSTSPVDESSITVTIIYKKQKRLLDCMHLYNVLFDRIMSVLKFVRFGKNKFDPTAPKIIPHHKLEVWPGYVTAVNEYEGGVMLCLDVSHRVLCQRTVLDLLEEASHSGDFQKNALTALLGQVVLTRYNNKTYRIDDIKFDMTPMSTFKTRDREITYVEYYKTQYNIDIKDKKQPLLLSVKERRVSGKVEKETLHFCIVPEISFLTGLTDAMLNDGKMMREISSVTRVTPNQRMHSFKTFCKNVNSTAEARDILANWGLTLDPMPINVEGRQLGEETIDTGSGPFSAGRDADFGNQITKKEVLEAVNITNWLLIYTRQDETRARSFVDCLMRNSRPMGIHVAKPVLEVLPSDNNNLYMQTLRKHINSTIQIVVIICPTSRDDRYAAIKKVCCVELPIPSQVINSNTLRNEAKNRSIVQKIALQMNCKLGGTLWSVKIPFKNVMICGIDTYHDAIKTNNSVSAFVASLNGTYTKWYSRAVIQSQKEELINGMCAALISALEEYKKMNDQYPKQIIIYRDGVGDGQLKMCKEYEIPQIMSACATIDEGYAPGITFMVVQKRINTRMFKTDGRSSELSNPHPGSIIDHTITRKHLYDFFLVSQNVRQGTVSPTHYIVVHDTNNFAPDILQRLSYKMCFLYYNWPGTVRIPACCQYAHKLAYLVGQSIKRNTAASLSNKLFYL